MRRIPASILVALLLLTLLIAGAAFAQSSGTATTTSTVAPDVLYDDSSATSSATITQILPNSQSSLITLGNVRRIRVQQEILVVEWGTTATSLFPRQFVGSINVNKRADSAH